MGVGAVALRSTAYALAAAIGSYVLFVAVLAIPAVQNQVIYLNRISLTWFQDANYPEQWGFLHNQVTPFNLQTADGETLHAWHVLPLGLYHQHAAQLVREPPGLVADVAARHGFRLLRDDPEALLVLYFHGGAGTLGSGYRPPSYRAMYALEPHKIHTVAIDYRGFGTSSGCPSEEDLLQDAIAMAEWAMEEAGIPPDRIVLFGQSLGTAVATSMAHHYATKPGPVFFSGMAFVAPFVDVKLLTATYRLAGAVPLLGPVARFPQLLDRLNAFIRDKWPTRDKLAALVRLHESRSSSSAADASPPRARYWVNLIHAEDDYDIPWTHSEELFWHAADAAAPAGISYEQLEREKAQSREDRGAGGWSVERRTERGVLIEDILKHGLHDRTMSYPAVSSAIWRAFKHNDPV